MAYGSAPKACVFSPPSDLLHTPGSGADLGADATYGSVGSSGSKPTRYNYNSYRRRAHFLGYLVTLLAPWVEFSLIFGLLSFSIHYNHFHFVWFIVLLLAGPAFICGCVTYHAARKRLRGDTSSQPSWYSLLFTTLALGWFLGVLCGSYNFTSHMRSFYEISSLTLYTGIDPGKLPTTNFQDAGRVIFTEDTKVDVARSLGFRQGDMYCVAPIVSSHQDPSQPYDVWAVGRNCCGGGRSPKERPGDVFRCGGAVGSPTAHAGVRVFAEDDQRFFQLAVENAESAHNLTASNPLFFTWTEDSMAEARRGQAAGFKNFIVGVVSFFVFQLFAVSMSSMAPSRTPTS